MKHYFPFLYYSNCAIYYPPIYPVVKQYMEVLADLVLGGTLEKMGLLSGEQCCLPAGGTLGDKHAISFLPYSSHTGISDNMPPLRDIFPSTNYGRHVCMCLLLHTCMQPMSQTVSSCLLRVTFPTLYYYSDIPISPLLSFPSHWDMF